MGLFSRFFGGRQERWEQFEGEPPQFGPLTLEPDGVFAFGPFRFDQSCTISNTSIGGAMVNKNCGAGEVLSVETPHGELLRLKFESNVWWYDASVA